MPQRPLLIALLVAATVVFDVALFWGLALDYLDDLGLPWPTLRKVVVFYALTISQANLLAAWVGLGRSPLPWRLAGATLAIALLAAPEAVLNLRREGTVGVPATFAILLVHAIAVGAACWIVRLAGLTLVSGVDVAEVQAGREARRPFQFPLRRMFAWMTSIAAVLAVFRCVVHYAGVPDLHGWWFELLVASVADAALALAAVWVVLGGWRPVWGTLALAATTAGAIAVNYRWADLTPLWDGALFCVLQVLWLAVSLAVVRVAGYRLVWRPGAPS